MEESTVFKFKKARKPSTFKFRGASLEPPPEAIVPIPSQPKSVMGLYHNPSQRKIQPKGTPFKPTTFGTAVVATLAGYDFDPSLINSEDYQKVASSIKRKTTVTSTAKLLGTTKNAIYRVAKAYLKGGEKEVERLRWGSGRPSKCMFLT